MPNILATAGEDHYSRPTPGPDAALDIAMGNLPGHFAVQKHGRAPGGVQITATDIWDRADATPTQQIWDAPTEARIHTIVSSSASDDGAPAGEGARTLRVYGLTSWATAETSEDIILNGVTDVPTVNAYVIVHRLEVITKGATSTNVGTITATAATDATITAAVLPGVGRTQMAILGFPSTQVLCLTQYYAGLRASVGASQAADVELLFNPEPDAELTNFRTVHPRGVNKNGTSTFDHPFNPYRKLVGPGILKINCIGSEADMDMFAGFGGILVDN